MKLLRALVVCLALTTAACGGSDITSPEAPSAPTTPRLDGGNGYAGSGG